MKSKMKQNKKKNPPIPRKPESPAHRCREQIGGFQRMEMGLGVIDEEGQKI